MKYLVGWGVVGDKFAMRAEDLVVLEGRSTYNVEKDYITKYYKGPRKLMSDLVKAVRAKCLEDDRYSLSLNLNGSPSEIAEELNIKLVEEVVV